MKIIVYGPGCARCHETERLVRAAAAEADIAADIEKVSDFAAMAKAGVLTTPAVAVNGVVKSTGRIPDKKEIKTWLSGN